MECWETTVQEPQGRIDRYLAERFSRLSRSTIQRLIVEERVLVNHRPTKPSYRPQRGDVIRVELPPEPQTTPRAEAIPLHILYEDDDILVIDKPPGLVVHPGAGHCSGTLVNALLAHRPDIVGSGSAPSRPGIVHRLDQDTSGVLVTATNREAQVALQAQFKAREVSKVYLALVQGELTPSRGAIEAPLGRHPRHRQRMAVLAEGGRYARTEYEVREHLPGVTFLEARLLTGRTHQLRVHFYSIGHPIVGDSLYGYRRSRVQAPRQMLHAWKLGLTHPASGEWMVFAAEIPADIAAVLQDLRGQL